MAKKLVSKTAKVLSETKKSKDKEAIAIAYEHIPRNPEEQAHGSLYAVLSIEDKSGHAEAIAEAIIDALHNEYYMDVDREPLASFESALAKINEELAERSSEGQINWLGKLNGVLAILSGSTIHLTQAGKAEAYLYRGEHTMHITEDLAGDSINPLRTFINIASGDLTENDKLVLLTPGVFLKLSKNEVKKYVTENSPKNAVTALSQLLAGDSGAVLPNSILVMEMVSPETFAAEPAPEMPSEAWVKEEKAPLQDVSDNTIHGAAKTFDLIGKAAAGTSAFIATRMIPSIKSGSANLVSKVKNFRKKPGAERIILESEERVEHPTKKETVYEDDGILDSGDKAEGYQEIRIREADHKPTKLSLERFDFSFAKNAKDGLTGFFKKNKWSGAYLLIGLVLLIAIFGGITYFGNNQKAKTEAKNQYSQAEAKYNEAEAALTAGQRSEAIEDLSAAETLANQAKTAPSQKSNANALLTKISDARDQAMGVVKNTAVLAHDFGKSNSNSVFTDGTLLYVLGGDGTVTSYDPKSKSASTIISSANLSSPVKLATYVSDRNVIAVATNDQNLYELNLSTKRVTKQNVTGGLAAGVALASYGTSNIYLLVPSANQIYKYVKSGSTYGAKVNYLSTGSDVSGDVSMAIDSSVYVSTAGGTIQKFTSGKPDNFTVKGYPQTYSGLTGLLADANVKGQYLFGGNKVIQLDQNQTFASQYISDSIKTVDSITVNDGNSTIYALSSGKLYAIPIK